MEGTSFGHYQLLALLGRGGMGEVWRAYDTNTDRVVALKVVHAHLSHDKTFLQRFRREAHAATRLNNRHVIPIHTYGEIDGRLYLDMRMVQGRDLDTLLRDGPLEPSRAVGIIEQVALALHAAHTAGMVHRDVKPSNVLLEDDDFAYLIDFGIARVVADTDMTGSGNVIGTWGYMAPERFTNPEIDARSDVYALACVLYECLTGTKPFPGDSPELQFGGHLGAPPPRPSVDRPWVDERFDTVIAKGMAKAPEKRYQTALELATAAREAVSGSAAPDAVEPAPTSSGPVTVSTFASAADQSDLHSDVTMLRPAAPAVARSSWRRKRVLVPAAAVVAIVIATVATTVTLNGPSAESSYEPAPAAALGVDTQQVAVDPPDQSLGLIPAVATARPSVVKIRAVASSCRQVNAGSGFVVAPNRVMTTARNVAGSDTVTVEADGRTYDAHVTSYDPADDVALLDVPDLPSAPLAFDGGEVPTGADAVILGYPGGEDFTATPARIREIIQLNGPDVYRTSTVARETYTFRGTVRQGDSGGPLIDTGGRVLGLVVAADANDADTGYALTSSQLNVQMIKLGNTAKVPTGACVT
ncbi:protein kinase domain-containing protein [Mycolicibacterium arenosum]|uniref:non-specific serine/threonine protein kinase n=1 Tax=Mycolicibacterium arenosum TaxID=2952157 RepID=A0ABT1M550_9MYCO|nr:protein kinase [Mycolicibacterium sp. CAU 1645]MCP9273995.1 protein kinase [Mycolicibacterium sp. CAU 1645]